LEKILTKCYKTVFQGKLIGGKGSVQLASSFIEPVLKKGIMFAISKGADPN
jgi:hypothetical protein